MHNSSELKSSSRRVIFLLLIICAGVLYYIWLGAGGPAVPCLFHEVTGLKCPGCGITRMLIALSKGDLAAAADANVFLLCTSPLAAFLIVYSAYKWVRCERTGRKFEAVAVIYCVCLILFGIVRNLF